MKFLKHLFTVPEGQKVTERHFKRVLISSICGILLCMSCLMSTTWAWYTASVVGEFEAQVSEYELSYAVDGNAQFVNGTELQGQHTVVFGFTTDADVEASDVSYNPGRYIIVTLINGENASVSYYVTADTAVVIPDSDKIRWETTLKLDLGEPCQVWFEASWTSGNANELDGDTIVVSATVPATTTAATTEALSATTEASGETGTTSATTETTKATEVPVVTPTEATATAENKEDNP